MQYREIKRRVMEYLNQYSIAGAEIPVEYNNQSDYLHRIPGLINAALVEIYSAVPKRATAQLRGGQVQGNWILYPFPKNCKTICTGGVYSGADMEPTKQYRLFGGSGILVPNDGLTYWIEYWQKPEQLILGTNQSGDPEDTYELDEDVEAIEAACVYVASWLALDTDAFDHTALNNLFEGKLARMRPPLTAEVQTVGGDFAFVNSVGVW